MVQRVGFPYISISPLVNANKFIVEQVEEGSLEVTNSKDDMLMAENAFSQVMFIYSLKGSTK